MNFAKDKLKIIDIYVWKNKLWNDSGQGNGHKLRTYRLYKSDLNPESYAKINMDRTHCRILTKFRSGSLPLNIETGRYAKPKVPLIFYLQLCCRCLLEENAYILHFIHILDYCRWLTISGYFFLWICFNFKPQLYKWLTNHADYYIDAILEIFQMYMS